jgi:hypothetical protein
VRSDPQECNEYGISPSEYLHIPSFDAVKGIRINNKNYSLSVNLSGGRSSLHKMRAQDEDNTRRGESDLDHSPPGEFSAAPKTS